MMRTAVVSDLHIRSRLRIDLLRRPDVLDKLLDGLTGVDRLVLLGDTLELRDRPLRAVLELARPFFAAIGEVCRDGEVWLVPGNHDHWIAREVLGRQTGRPGLRGGLSHAHCFAPPDRTIAARIASDLGCPVVIGYPGIYLAPGVFATHGHYADAHSSALSLETGLTALAVAARPGMRHEGPASAADYEAVLAPTYALYDGIAQRRRLQAAADVGKRLVRAAETRAGSRGAVHADGASTPVRRLESSGRRRRFGTVTGERRRPGVLPLARVLERLEVDAHTVLFGHTHRIGPVEGDPGAWTTTGGIALHNTGSWVLEPGIAIAGRGPAGDRPTTLDPYRPGVVTFVDGDGGRASRLLRPGRPCVSVLAPSLAPSPAPVCQVGIRASAVLGGISIAS